MRDRSKTQNRLSYFCQPNSDELLKTMIAKEVVKKKNIKKNSKFFKNYSSSISIWYIDPDNHRSMQVHWGFLNLSALADFCSNALADFCSNAKIRFCITAKYIPKEIKCAIDTW